jgi:hypothetical protein
MDEGHQAELHCTNDDIAFNEIGLSRVQKSHKNARDWDNLSTVKLDSK